MKIPKWVYDRITEITKTIVGDSQWSINQRSVLRRFLADIWLGEADDDSWVICTVRDIREYYASLSRNCEINYQGKVIESSLLDFLPTLPDVSFLKGRAHKNADKRSSNTWRFSPERPASSLGSLELVDAETGEAITLRELLKSNGKAPKHDIGLEKRQGELRQSEKQFLGMVARGRMHVSFVKALRQPLPEQHYRAGIRSLNHLYNAKIKGRYATYDHNYRLTFGGRYYDRAFQNLPNDLKAKFRSGLLNYDIEGCSLACLNRLFARHNIDYRIYSTIYAEIMERTGLLRKQCKQMVHTTIYRVGRVTVGTNDGLGEAVCEWFGGNEKKTRKMLRWWRRFVSPFKEALEDLLEHIQQEHRQNCSSPRNYHRYVNDVGLILDLNDEKFEREREHHQQYARDKSLLAFMTTGVEQAYIRELVRLNPGRVCMLDHDGVVALGELVLPDWAGFNLTIKD